MSASTTNPTTAARHVAAAAHTTAGGRIRVRDAAMTTANGTDSTPIGWTTASGANTSAPAWTAEAIAVSETPPTQVRPGEAPELRPADHLRLTDPHDVGHRGVLHDGRNREHHRSKQRHEHNSCPLPWQVAAVLPEANGVTSLLRLTLRKSAAVSPTVVQSTLTTQK
jgi:hypothetical protein